MSFKHKHILGIEQMSKEDIEIILDTADAFKEINYQRHQESADLARQDDYQRFF